MERINNFVKNLQKIRSIAIEVLMQVLKEHEDEILALNTDNQLYDQGINADGVKISSYDPYSGTTISWKKDKGQPYDRVTLKDDGDFHDSFFLDIDKQGIFFDASDIKAKDLTERYGEMIYGLTVKNITYVKNSIIIPNFTKKLQNRLKL